MDSNRRQFLGILGTGGAKVAAAAAVPEASVPIAAAIDPIKLEEERKVMLAGVNQCFETLKTLQTAEINDHSVVISGVMHMPRGLDKNSPTAFLEYVEERYNGITSAFNALRAAVKSYGEKFGNPKVREVIGEEVFDASYIKHAWMHSTGNFLDDDLTPELLTAPDFGWTAIEEMRAKAARFDALRTQVERLKETLSGIYPTKDIETTLRIIIGKCPASETDSAQFIGELTQKLEQFGRNMVHDGILAHRQSSRAETERRLANESATAKESINKAPEEIRRQMRPREGGKIYFHLGNDETSAKERWGLLNEVVAQEKQGFDDYILRALQSLQIERKWDHHAMPEQGVANKQRARTAWPEAPYEPSPISESYGVILSRGQLEKLNNFISNNPLLSQKAGFITPSQQRS